MWRDAIDIGPEAGDRADIRFRIATPETLVRKTDAEVDRRTLRFLDGKLGRSGGGHKVTRVPSRQREDRQAV